MRATKSQEQILLEAALRCESESERKAFLDAACANDPGLRRRIEELLAASSEADAFFREDPLKKVGIDPAAALQTVPGAPVTEGPGSVIDKYKLLEQLGEGGFGVVYMAEQREPVKRRVALKIIKIGMDTREVVARFEAERQALAMMDHPNIAKVFDAGATEGRLPSRPKDGDKDVAAPLSAGRPYFVMELVRGVKITDYCDDKKLSTRERLDLFIKVCQAVQHAHQKGIIHRDLKPSNIMVTVNDGVAVPKIIDFGIAKATQAELTEKTMFTRFHQFIGTPAYLSPEQAELTSLDIDTRSDIYSLGVLLYELLTGKTPFDAEELLKAGLDEMRRTIREVEPVKPSTRLTQALVAADVRRLHSKSEIRNPKSEEEVRASSRRLLQLKELIPLLRGDLDWIVMKCLEKDRARRYETANGLASDIQRHLNNEPVVACPPSAAYRFRKLVRRNKLVFAAGASVVAALVTGLGVATWMFVKERAAEREQSRLRQQAQTEAARSQQVARFLKEMLNGVGPAVARGRDATILREILDQTAKRIGEELKDQPDVEADLRLTIADVYAELGQDDKAEGMYREALALSKKRFGDEHPFVATVLNNLANTLGKQGRQAEAEAMHRKALAMRRTLLGNEHPEVAASLDNLAYALHRQGKATEAEALHRESLAMRRKLLGNDHAAVATSLNNLAVLLHDEGKLPEAESMYREALALHNKLHLGEDVDLAIQLMNLGVVLGAEGNLVEAETLVREALEMAKRLLGSEHPDLGDFLDNLSGMLRSRGKWAEAETMARESLAIKRKALTDKHPAVAASLSGLADVLRVRGNLVEAESKQREALAIEQTLFGNEHPDVGNSLLRLGVTLRDEAKLAEAETTLREALVMIRKLRGNEHPAVSEILSSLMDVLMRERKFDEAERLVNELPSGDDKPQSVGLRRSGTRANFFARQGQWKEAIADYQRAIALAPTNHWAYHALAPLLVQSGDLDGYRKHCQQEVAQFRDTKDSTIAERMAMDCLLLPDSGVDLAATDAWADRAVAETANHSYAGFRMCAKSFAEYRQRRFASARDWMQKALSCPKSFDPQALNACLDVRSYAGLAMAHYQLKQTDEAGIALSKAVEIANTKLPKLDSRDIGVNWLDSIIGHAFLREAKALLESQAAPANERTETTRTLNK